MIQEHDTVVLVCDLPALGLERGDVGAVIHIYNNQAAAEVEFVSGGGMTVGVETLKQGCASACPGRNPTCESYSCVIKLYKGRNLTSRANPTTHPRRCPCSTWNSY